MYYFIVSNSNKYLLASSPPPYPVKERSLPIIRWQGINMEMALAPFALATARTALGHPIRIASSP